MPHAPIRSIDELLKLTGLDRADCPHTLDAAPAFSMLVPLSYAARMRPGDWQDPLLLQVLPLAQERIERHGFIEDPVGDRAAQVAPGVIHKYHGRALLLATGACAMHCRYCFRRSFPVTNIATNGRALREAWAYIRARRDISELVLSGGDPLMLGADGLMALLRPAPRIAHLRVLRIHSRVPVADPRRIGAALQRALQELAARVTVVIVLHANCAEELDEEVHAALRRLRRAGALLLNQAVLLRGINDTTAAQERLCRRLLICGVLPYYLHQLDRAEGTWHFEVDEERGRRLMQALRERLPGYLLPRYVREQAGACAKLPLE